MHSPSIAERIAFGRPLDDTIDAPIRVAERSTTALIGRILVGAIFLVSGIAKLTNTDETIGYHYCVFENLDRFDPLAGSSAKKSHVVVGRDPTGHAPNHG